MMHLWHAFMAIIQRDLVLAFRRRSELLNPVLFFIMIASLFPLGVTPDEGPLKMMAPGVIWIAALLSALFSLETLFRAKILAHWMITGFPMLIFAPLLGLLFQLDRPTIMVLEMTLLLGTPLLSLIGSVGIALTVGLRKGGVLLSLIVLPLMIPVLIFATSAVTSAALGMEVDVQINLLLALLMLALTVVPLATAFGLRISLS